MAVYCFDIDGTICTNTNGAYEGAVPFKHVIDKINGLYNAGHKIIFHTARGSTTGINWTDLTKRQLEAWKVKYHELIMGKPYADFYLDDKSVESKDFLTNEKMSSGRVVCFNGSFVPESEARISIYDSALMFGDTVFEMTRSFNKVQFKLREHLERLYASAKYVHIDIPISINEMEKIAYKTMEANDPVFEKDDEHRLVINITRGILSIYKDAVEGHKGTNIFIADFPLRWTVSGMGKLYDEGIDAVVPSQRIIPASLIEPKVKNRSRLHYMMANIEVSKYKGQNAWALLLDPDGFIAEGTGANFLMVKDGCVITPEPRNILRGISRAYVMDELCKQLNIPCYERNIELYDVVTADEAFFTGTPFCMLPVTKINGLPIGSGAMGPLTRKLLNKWCENVGVNIIEQIKGWVASSKSETASSPSPYQFRG